MARPSRRGFTPHPTSAILIANQFYWSSEVANPLGRPTKYNEGIQAQADEYLATWSDRDAIPSRVGLCCFIGISKHTSFEWEKIHPAFSATLEAIEALQEHTAINKGITGAFNSTITKLVLANHGYSDKQITDHQSTDGSMTPKDHSAAVLDALKAKHDAK